MPSPRHIRFIDICAGLGGFHRGLEYMAHAIREQGEAVEVESVFACDINDDLRPLYLENFPDIKAQYLSQVEQGHWPQEPEPAKSDSKAWERWNARSTLSPNGQPRIHGDLAHCLDLVPPHDMLCAGFPCQPFSKSGEQLGLDDTKASGRGTVFHRIMDVIRTHKPRYVFLENVGNFERHDKGNTWRTVQSLLTEAGYVFRATNHKATKGLPYEPEGLLSPHQLGYAHHRERFFIVAERADSVRLDWEKRGPHGTEYYQPFPERLTADSSENLDRENSRNRSSDPQVRRGFAITSMKEIVLEPHADEKSDLAETTLTDAQTHTIEFWNRFLRDFGRKEFIEHLPSFPIWGFELNQKHHYPFETKDRPPTDYSLQEINAWRTSKGLSRIRDREAFIASWPAYASRRDKWPSWKINFIRQNREFSATLYQVAEENDLDEQWEAWLEELNQKPPSSQKLEWNCKGEVRDLYAHVLQFRPSGLRVKRYENVPALVAMTSTQIPILGPAQRFMTRSEGLRAQGFPTPGKPLAGVHAHALPESRTKAFKALGNAVHAKVIQEICMEWLWAEGRYVPGRDDRQIGLFAEMPDADQEAKAATI